MRIGLVGCGVQTLEAGPDGGLLRDLGSHLVDQALWLFGSARRVTANLDWLELPEGRTDAGFVVTIAHAGGVHSHVSASKVNRIVSRELRVLGSLGSYEVSERWGTLSVADGIRRVPSEQA